MGVKLLTEHHLEFLSLKEGCTGSSGSTQVCKKLHCWKSHATAHLSLNINSDEQELRWGNVGSQDHLVFINLI